MDDAKVPVTAEWALWGKEPSDLEYRLLRTGEGAIGHREFEENITRYSPGALHDLPQVTVNGFLIAAIVPIWASLFIANQITIAMTPPAANS